MAKNILCVHGVGHQETNPDFASSWRRAIDAAVDACAPKDPPPQIDFLAYDSLFQHDPLDFDTYVRALEHLAYSYVRNGIENELFAVVGGVFGTADGLFRTRLPAWFDGLPDLVRWTAGMTAQWASEEELRRQLRTMLLAALKAKNYDIVIGHSLGSLICYDTLSRNPDAAPDAVFISLGSQIGHPAVQDLFTGRIMPLKVRHWYNLHNPYDLVFTAPVKVQDPAFEEVITSFVEDPPLHHAPELYLAHKNAVAHAWRAIYSVGQPKVLANLRAAMRHASVKPVRRALLIGIDAYPDQANQLAGCVNDAFLMSAVLQESGFDAGDIRLVLNERATAAGIMDRLHWLLDGANGGDQRFLFYSGHGARLTVYDAQQRPAAIDECLVPYDFDWTAERAIRDEQFRDLYSQLPYECEFTAMFDCCHAGGMTRDGGARVRGLEPPDDIRHRAMQWSAASQTWVPRDFAPINPSLQRQPDGEDWVGENGAIYRLGRAAALRRQPNKKYDAGRAALRHSGPYMPVLLEACRSRQYSYEYRHGATSHGAYTYCFARILREQRARGRQPTYRDMHRLVGKEMAGLGYDQAPVLMGPGFRRDKQVF